MSISLDLDEILQALSQSSDFGLEACRNFAQLLIHKAPGYAPAEQLRRWSDRKVNAHAQEQQLDPSVINRYRVVMNEELELFKALDQVVIDSGEPLEGNCFYYHLSLNPSILLENKRINLFSAASRVTKILEIGFNAGHSAALMLLANPDSRLLAFDICEHQYTEKCFMVLSDRFGDRIDLIPGDSNTTVPQFRFENPAVYFDLLHIDGSHDYQAATTDFMNCHSLAKHGSLMIWDDTNNSDLDLLFDAFVVDQLISERFDLLPTFTYCHRVGTVLKQSIHS